MPKRGGWDSTGFGSKLKALRESAGLSQPELAEKAGCNKFTIAKLEQGRQEPAWPLVLSLCEALNVTCEAFKPVPGEHVAADLPTPRGRPPRNPPPKPRRPRPPRSVPARRSRYRCGFSEEKPRRSPFSGRAFNQTSSPSSPSSLGGYLLVIPRIPRITKSPLLVILGILGMG